MPPHFSLLVLLLFFLLLLLLYSFQYSSSQKAPILRSRNAPAAEFLSFFSSSSSNSTVSSHLRCLTRRPHLAGTPSSAAAAAYVLSRLRSAGLQTLTRTYSPLLSYPSSSSLSLLRPDRSLLKPLSLLEPADPSASSGVVPPYHAYSPSGSAVAPPVFVNFGRDEDYAALDKLGVEVSGKVVIVRRGAGPRGAVVAKAAEKGAEAVVMFGDRTDGGVERGTVMSCSVGDPLTPGWAAVGAGGAERLREEDEEVRRRLPRIPSMPVSAETATEILRALGGPAAPEEWRVGAAAEVGGVGGGSVLLNFTYREDRRLATIQNVFGVIKGREEPDRYVILGNHRDAWTYGAVDPNSGTAALLVIAQYYGALLSSGWRPRRTIILCSWDAEEFGMIGSTEWVEQNVGILGSNAVAYLNVDCAVQGPGFFASATPQLDNLLIEITKQVSDPDVEGMSVYQTWVATNGGINIERLARADSDFSAFLHHVGVPSVDLYYGKEFSGYHTALDSYESMEKHVDPLFHRHVAISEVWGLLGFHLADDPVLPFDYLSYATQLQDHTNALKVLLEDGEAVQPIVASVIEFSSAAYEALEEAKQLRKQEAKEGSDELKQRSYNDRILLVERGFLEAEGLTGRPWFKHLLYAPPEDYESKLSFFPGIADAISRARKVGRREGRLLIQHEIWRVARAIQRAAAILRGELT